MRVAFTGTRHGMNARQTATLELWLRANIGGSGHVAHHGMAIGADSQFHRILRRVFAKRIHIEGWPSNIPGQRDETLDIDVRHPEMKPLLRNLKIVERADILLAAPFEMGRPKRYGGTWSTIGKAERRGIPVEIFWREEKACQ